MKRIRGYFASMAAQHLLLGWILLRSLSELSESTSMIWLVKFAPLWVWATAMLVVGAACLGGMIAPRERPGRVVAIVSFVLTVSVVACLVAAMIFEDSVVGGYAVLLGVLAAKDYLILGLPWTDPFENIPAPGECRLEAS